MLPKALNHICAPNLRWDAFLDLARQTGCVGVEFRNDLGSMLFEGADPTQVGAAAKSADLRILALAEVKTFDHWTDQVAKAADALIATAKGCGAEAISLIPCNGGQSTDLRGALHELAPMLRAAGLRGFVEPLGFETASLRQKSQAVDAIEAVGAADVFALIHDTFHHTLAGGGPVFAEHTGLVHISGVTAEKIAITQMRDPHRGLVDASDRLGNLEQLEALMMAGYTGPISFEPFAPQVQQLSDPATALAGSFAFISSRLADKAA